MHLKKFALSALCLIGYLSYGLASAATLVSSSISTQALDTAAAIIYSTDSPSKTWIVYGPSLSYGSEYKADAFAITHVAVLTNLMPGTTYYFHVRTIDKNGVVSSDRRTTAYSTFTTKTRASQAIAGQQPQPAVKFGATLRMGQRHPEVKQLQQALNRDPRTQVAVSGAGSPGKETDYFGMATQRAVIKFQELYASTVLAPAGLAKGTGLVGALTRAKLNELARPATAGQISGTVGAVAPAPTPPTYYSFGGGGGGGPSSQSAQPAPAQQPAAPTQSSGGGSSATPGPTLAQPTAATAAADYYVSVTGAGSHNGTAQNPFSLAEARAFANSNPAKAITFSLASGNYGEFIETAARGQNAWVTYQAADPANKPIFKGSGVNPAIYIKNAAPAYVKFINIEARADRETAVEVENSNYVTVEKSLILGTRERSVVGYAFRAWKSDYVTLADSTVTYGTNGVSTLETDFLTITGNDIGFSAVDGLHFSDMSDFTVTGNYVHDTRDIDTLYPDAHQDSLQIDAGPLGVRRGTITGNRFENSDGQGVFIAKNGHIPTYTIDKVTIADNKITGKFAASPFQIDGTNLTITGNIVNAESPIISLLLETVSGVTFKNNSFNGKFLNCAKGLVESNNTFGQLLSSASCSPTQAAQPAQPAEPTQPVQAQPTSAVVLDHSADFNGSTDKITLTSNLNRGAGAYTISAKIYATGVAGFNGGDGNGIIMSLSDSNGELGDFGLTVDTSGRVAFMNWRASGDAQTKYLTPEGTIADNSWYRVTAVYDGSSSKIYVNGIDLPLAAGYLGSGYQAGNYIGTAYPPAAAWYWKGKLDDIRVYDSALSASEISLLQ